MIFGKQDLKNMLWDEGPLEVIEDEITDTGRWSVYHKVVFRNPEGRFFSTTYSKGATEYQDERPFDNEPDEIECKEVFPIKKEITVYE